MGFTTGVITMLGVYQAVSKCLDMLFFRKKKAAKYTITEINSSDYAIWSPDGREVLTGTLSKPVAEAICTELNKNAK